jgi:hypothetical protein
MYKSQTIDSDTSQERYAQESDENQVQQKSVCNDKKGDSIHTKEPTSIRILFQNINSLRPQNLDKWKASIERVQHLECDIIGLVETCTNWSNKNCLINMKIVYIRQEETAS